MLTYILPKSNDFHRYIYVYIYVYNRHYTDEPVLFLFFVVYDTHLWWHFKHKRRQNLFINVSTAVWNLNRFSTMISAELDIIFHIFPGYLSMTSRRLEHRSVGL